MYLCTFLESGMNVKSSLMAVSAESRHAGEGDSKSDILAFLFDHNVC